MSAKDLLQKAEALIAEAIGTDTPPPPASGLTAPASPQAPVATVPSVAETGLEAARLAKASEAKQ